MKFYDSFQQRLSIKQLILFIVHSKSENVYSRLARLAANCITQNKHKYSYIFSLISHFYPQRSSRGFTISKAYFKVAEYDIARDWLQRYLEIRTEDPQAHKFMGELLEKLGKPEQAITSYQRSYNLNSKQNDLIKHGEFDLIVSVLL